MHMKNSAARKRREPVRANVPWQQKGQYMEKWQKALGDQGHGITSAVEAMIKLWTDISPELRPKMFGVVSPGVQEENKIRLEGLLEKAGKHMKSFSQAVYGQKTWRRRTENLLLAAMDQDVMFQLGQLPPDVRARLLEGTKSFVRHTREFDGELSLEDMGQALRNYFAYFMLCLAGGEDTWFHKAVWAYSLLYPYTDNFVDGESSGQEKAAFNERLSKRLRGEAAVALTPLEKKVFALLDEIESVYKREDFCQVYDFLMIIYDAQIKSLEQHGRKELSDRELIFRSVYKGGASVYVDQCLIKGHVEKEDILFLTGLGFFLQLADDLQDVEEDLKAGHRTCMTKGAVSEMLDEEAGKLLGFLLCLFENFWTGEDLGREFLLENCAQMVFMTVLQKQQYFTEGFVDQISRWAVLPCAYCARMDEKSKELRENFLSFGIDPLELLDVWSEAKTV